MGKPPRQSGRKVTFTPEAAQRIARAVVAVEKGDRSIGAPGRQSAAGDDAIIRGKFSGSWAKGSTKTVTDATLSAVTYEAKNYFNSISETGQRDCLIAYVGGEWALVAVASPSQGIVRGTFTAPWAKGSTKTVSDAVTSGVTYANVRNYFAAVGGTGSKACAIAYVGTEWILIAAECG